MAVILTRKGGWGVVGVSESSDVAKGLFFLSREWDVIDHMFLKLIQWDIWLAIVVTDNL